MSAYAIYRLPHANYYTKIEQTEGEPAELQSCVELNGKNGFVLAPFEVKEQQPILLIRPDRVERISLDDAGPSSISGISNISCLPSMEYAIDFANLSS